MVYMENKESDFNKLSEIHDSAKNALTLLLDGFEKTGIPVPTLVVAELEYIIDSTKS
jgi:hypothetical protein